MSGSPTSRAQPDPRNTDDYQYPFSGTEQEQLGFLLNYAPLAPSHRNSQPWQFSLGDRYINIFADPDNSRNRSDPRDRQKLISCGAAINVLEITSRYFGHHSRVNICIDERMHQLATFRLAEPCHVSRKNTRMFHAIKSRQTNRRDYKKVRVTDNLQKHCQLKAKDFEVAADFTHHPEKRHEVARLVSTSIKELYSDPWYRREFAESLRSSLGKAKDGIYNFEHLPLNIPPLLASPVIKTVDMSNKVADFFEKKIRFATETLLLICSETDSPQDWLKTGRALNKVLVYLASEGFTASYLNYPIEFPYLRKQLAGVFNAEGVPQILLRVGVAEKVKPTGRHPFYERFLS